MNRVVCFVSFFALFSFSSCLPARGAIISFMGAFTSGSGSLLGNLPPAQSFSAQLNFDAVTPGFAIISSGTLTFTSQMLNVTSGNIFVSESGAADQATVLFNTSGPTGSLSVTFIGNAISDNLVNQANLNALIVAGSPATITADFNSAGSYTGSVTAVPEPSSIALLGLGITMFGAVYRARKRSVDRDQADSIHSLG